MTDWEVLSGLPPVDRDRIIKAGRRRRYARGETILHAGDPGDALHLIASGRVAVRVLTPNGEQAILAVLGPGKVFGELALLLEHGHRTASITALEPCETIVLHKAQFDQLRARYPAVDRFLLAALSAQVARLSEHLLEMLFVPARARILRRLLVLAKEFEGGLVHITQEDLALMSGTTRSTVNEVLREAEQAGSIRLGRGRVEVLDRARLARRAH
jgi:CRP/FNR family transcriptional regulator, cyclic AMP receptor protein